MNARLLSILLLFAALPASAATYTFTVEDPVFDQPYALDVGRQVEAVQAVSYLVEGSGGAFVYRCQDMGGDLYEANQSWWFRYVFDDGAILYDGYMSHVLNEPVPMNDVQAQDWSFLDDGLAEFELRRERISMGWDCIFDHTDLQMDRLTVTIEYTATVGDETSRWETVKRMFR